MLFAFLSDVVDPPATLVMGADKHENDSLTAQATERVLFFHVDALPSAHVYLQLEPGQRPRDVPAALLQDAAQLCKANSTQGNKLNNVAVIYTPGSNLHKPPKMKAGEGEKKTGEGTGHKVRSGCATYLRATAHINFATIV
ncbi:coiled-coil domain-containing protein 25-like [Eriocheir sinensis]|uniref:coiled-coil domain-containing protein 25-like n=1 Tax=Eriocheir sinensis TaxID=95602 RepID=UPI0021C58256|nr:coiled-coil domain-containing protein 25-like [Eriocheir sinensis]